MSKKLTVAQEIAKAILPEGHYYLQGAAESFAKLPMKDQERLLQLVQKHGAPFFWKTVREMDEEDVPVVLRATRQ